MHSIENFIGSPTVNNPTFRRLPFMESQTFANVGRHTQASNEDTDRDNNEEHETASDCERNERLEIMNGTYVCTNCDTELFSSSARVITKRSSDSTLDFSHAICNDAIQRIPATKVKESIPISCAKCLQPVGNESFKISPDGNQVILYTVKPEILRFVPGKKKS